jgi:xanthine dehydrogenase molybdopterin-binding subunit B
MPDASLADLAKAAIEERVSLTGSHYYRMDFESHDRPFMYFSYGTACSEVELDVLTGEYQILESNVTMDVGKSLNPTIDIGQVCAHRAMGCA